MRPSTLLMAALWLGGCADPTAAIAPDAAAVDFQLIDATPEPDAAPPPDAAPSVIADAAPEPDAAPVDLGVVDADSHCDDDTLRCPEPGTPAIDRCQLGRWQRAECRAGEICLDARCQPDPRGCAEGVDRVCLGAHQPAVCAGEAWAAEARCPPGRRCRAGQCETEACADAADAGSYLGCAFLAVPLPNFASVYTPGTPVGLVLANPNAVEARLSVRDAAGRPHPLVAERALRLSDHPLVPDEAPALYPPHTVRSTIRDAAGDVVRDGLAEAADVAIPPGGTATLLLPPAGEDTLLSGVFPLAARVDADQPLAAYQFAPYCCNFSFSNDASLLFPVAALGRTYQAMTPPNFVFEGADSPGTVAIAAPTATTVDVHLPPGHAHQPLAGPGVEALGPDHYRVRLAPLDVVLLHTEGGEGPPADLTGATITADAPVAVFASHLCTFYPQAVGFCDHLEEQLPPVTAWGQRYALVPPPPRTRAHTDGQRVYYRLQAAAPGVTVTLSRPLDTLELGPPGAAGLVDCADQALDATHLRLDAPCELSTRVPLGVVADAPIQVMATLSGQDAVQPDSPFGTRAGDPALYLLPPDRQLRTQYDFLVPDTYARDFVTVVAPPTATLTLDGAPLDLAEARPIPGTARVYLHVPLDDGPHRLTGTRPFAIRVAAFDDFVSYAFTGGLDLRKP